MSFRPRVAISNTLPDRVERPRPSVVWGDYRVRHSPRPDRRGVAVRAVLLANSIFSP